MLRANTAPVVAPRAAAAPPAVAPRAAIPAPAAPVVEEQYEEPAGSEWVEGTLFQAEALYDYVVCETHTISGALPSIV